jgi:hypothetical protein
LFYGWWGGIGIFGSYPIRQKNLTMLKQNLKSSLVTDILDRASSEILDKYPDAIIELIGTSAGIYALYNNFDLYYVGRATQLRRRVGQHLENKHRGKWTHFSLYLVRHADHIGDIESLLINIAQPKGNSVKPKIKNSRNLGKYVIQIVKHNQEEERGTLFQKSISKRQSIKKSNDTILSGLVNKRTILVSTYKGKKYKAFLTPNGTLSFNGKKYTSLTAAAVKITKGSVSGWNFWKIKNSANKLETLKNYSGT